MPRLSYKAVCLKSEKDLKEGTSLASVFYLQGESIYRELMHAGTERKIKVRIAQSVPSSGSPDYDTADLAKAGMFQI